MASLEMAEAGRVYMHRFIAGGQFAEKKKSIILKYILEPQQHIELCAGVFDESTLDVFDCIYSYVQIEKREIILSILEDLFLNTKFNAKTRKNYIYTYFEDLLRKLFEVLEEEESFCEFMVDKEDPTGLPIKVDFEEITVLSKNIVESICYKLGTMYNDKLPKKIQASFKENYPILYSALTIYKKQYEQNKKWQERFTAMEQRNAKKEAKEEYLKVPNNEGISDIFNNVSKFNPSIIKLTNPINKRAELVTSKKTIITLDSTDLNSFELTSHLEKTLTDSQVLLLYHVMNLYYKESEAGNKTNSIKIDVKEYCKLKGITFQKEVTDRLCADIYYLSRVEVEFWYTEIRNSKREKVRLTNSYLVNLAGNHHYFKDGDKIKDGEDVKKLILKNNVLVVNFGDWINTLNKKQYQLISPAIFKYRTGKGSTIVPVSLMINSRHRVNLHNFDEAGGEYAITVEELVNSLRISDSTIRAKGSKILKDTLEKDLTEIEEKEGFCWKYKTGNHKTIKDFKKDIIIFSNKELDNQYYNAGYKKKQSKKAIAIY